MNESNGSNDQCGHYLVQDFLLPKLCEAGRGIQLVAFKSNLLIRFLGRNIPAIDIHTHRQVSLCNRMEKK